jgi:hypothetical protein
MDVGIHENVELTEIKSETSRNGNHFLAFYFENERGEKVSKTEWEVNTDKDIEQMDSEEKERYLSKIQNQTARITTIAKQFVDKSELLFESNSFREFADTIKTKIGDNFKGIQLRIKVVYDYNDWATLPSYTKFPWIEKMEDVPTLDKSKIKILENVDKMTKSDDKPDKVKKEANPFSENNSGEAVVSEDKKDDLPF